MLKEFKAFIAKGNVVDLAVAVVIGAAFGKIVSALVDSIIMPLVGVVLGGVDFSGWQVTVGDSVFGFGLLVQAVVDFLIIAACVFMLVKAVDHFQRKEDQVQEVKAIDPEIELLSEIRDLLKKKK